MIESALIQLGGVEYSKIKIENHQKILQSVGPCQRESNEQCTNFPLIVDTLPPTYLCFSKSKGLIIVGEIHPVYRGNRGEERVTCVGCSGLVSPGFLGMLSMGWRRTRVE